MTPPPSHSDNESFTLKESITGLFQRFDRQDDKIDKQFRVLDEKQNLQIKNQEEMKVTVSLIPNMQKEITNLYNIVCDPNGGLVPRVNTIEGRLKTDYAKRQSRFNYLFQAFLAIIGAASVIIGSVLGVIHLFRN